jgi:DNA-3-methyladenine glycosylase II
MIVPVSNDLARATSENRKMGLFGQAHLRAAPHREFEPMTLAVARYELPVAEPYRLDLTASVLRRLSTNVVDVLAPDGAYLRVLQVAEHPMLVRVVSQKPGALTVTLEGEGAGHAGALETVRRILGTDATLKEFDRGAARIPWLRPLARRMRGVKPPRYPTLWEACVNAIVFQQVSIHAAGAILQRYVVALGSPFKLREGVTLYAFPDAEVTLRADDAELRAVGLSANKIATLRRVAEALSSGTLDDRMLEERTSLEATALLTSIKGIGPWTATVILLRGLGRLDVFPMNDSGVAGSVAFAGGSLPDLESVLDTLGSQRGMLYYHLLLARLEARGELRPSA